MDQKSQIMDEQTNTQIGIHSTQTNLNSQFYTSMDTSVINTQIYHHSNQSFKNYKNSPSQSDNQFCPQYQNYQNQPQISQYQNQLTSYQTKPLKPQLDLQKFALCLQSIEYSLTRVFYRAFQNKLISFYIQSLKQEQRKQRQTRQIQIKLLKEQNWPFKQLFYKKFKNQHEQIMFEFINMCAQKIQATFKGYVTHKRHKQAIKRISNFKQKLTAITIGWKTWNIYNCKKLKEMRKTAIEISTQIDSEIENPNLDRVKKMKKIDYLNSSQQVVKQNFHNSFQHLFDSGAWIYEVDKCFKKPLNNKKTSKNFQSNRFQGESAVQIQNQVSKNEEPRETNQTKPRTRKRQFQGGLNKNAKKSTTPTKPNSLYSDQPVTAKDSYESNINNESSKFQERPIVAKGKYDVTEQNIKNTQNELLKQNDNQKPNETKQEQQSPRINKFKDDEKKKLIKRQKYDPRKAIQEEKLKLQEEKKKKIQTQKEAPPETPNQASNTSNTGQKKKPQKKINQVNKKTPRIIKKEPQRRDLQSPRQSSKEKTVEKIKSHLTKKNDNSKSIKLIVNNKKVESKVYCWGPKKDSSQTQSTNEQSSYKSKYLISLKQKTESKLGQGSSYKQVDASRKLNREQKSISINEEEFIALKEEAPKINSKILRKNSQISEEETFQSSYLKKLGQQKEKGSFSYGGGKVAGQRKFIQKANQATQESYAQKIQQLDKNMKRLSENRSSMANLKNTNQQYQRKGSISQGLQTQPQKKKQEVHRSIQFLEDVYTGQYTDRFNTLKNKLNMLESTRYIQRDDTIPILLEDSKFIKKIYKDHTFSSLYWPQVRTMETNFLDYIKFSGF